MHTLKFTLCLLTSVLISRSTAVVAQTELSKILALPYQPIVDIADFAHIYFKWPEGKAQAYMNDGLNDLREGKINSASGSFSKVIELSPRFYAGYYYRGICYKQALKFNDAEKDFIKSLDYNDTLAAAQVEIGEMYEANHNFAKALQFYEKSIKDSQYYDGQFHLGNLSFVQNNMAAAELYYRLCIKINPSLAKAYTMLGLHQLKVAKNKSESIKFLSQAIEKDSTTREALFWRGLILVDMNELEKAMDDWTILVRMAPENPVFLSVRGILYVELGEFDDAYQDLKRAVLANPANEDKFLGNQTFTDKRIDLQSVMRYFIKKIYGFREPDVSYLKNGFCFMLAGRYNVAMNWLSKIQNPSGISRYLEGMMYENAAQHGIALRKYNEAIALDPELTEAYKKRGIYRMEMKDYKKAWSDFDEMTRLEPGLMVGFRLRGITSALMENCEASIQDMTVVLNRDSTDQEAFKTRAFCYENKQDWINTGSDFYHAFFLGKPDIALFEHAVTACEKALKENDTDQKSRYFLGRLILASGDKTTGLKHIKKASKEGYLPATAFLKSNN